jgi:hypothetical protein
MSQQIRFSCRLPAAPRKPRRPDPSPAIAWACLLVFSAALGLGFAWAF